LLDDDTFLNPWIFQKAFAELPKTNVFRGIYWHPSKVIRETTHKVKKEREREREERER